MKVVALDYYKLVFPRRFTSADARAWGSLYGFEHERATRRGNGRITLLQRPKTDFAGRFQQRQLADGVVADVGTPLVERRTRTSYDHHSAQLRKLALQSRPASREPNRDLVRFYERWVVRTHPGMTEDEADVAQHIARRLRVLDRQHALAYIAKLQASPLGS